MLSSTINNISSVDPNIMQDSINSIISGSYEIKEILIIASVVLGTFASIITIIRFLGGGEKNIRWVYAFAILSGMAIAFFSMLVLQNDIFNFDSYKFYSIISILIFSPVFISHIYAKTSPHFYMIKIFGMVSVFILSVLVIVHIYFNTIGP